MAPATVSQLSLIATLLWTLMHICMVQAEYTAAEKEEFVKVHNSLRSSPNPKPTKPLNILKWNDELERLTKESLKNRGCDGKHTNRSILGTKGENIYSFMWAPIDMEEPKVSTTPTASVRVWYDEKIWFNHKEYKCYPPKGKSCGHYYQVMWSEVTAIGCARCKTTTSMDGTNYNVVNMACQYDKVVMTGQQFYDYDKSTSCAICPLAGGGSPGIAGGGSPGVAGGGSPGVAGEGSPGVTNTSVVTIPKTAASISSSFLVPAAAVVTGLTSVCHVMP